MSAGEQEPFASYDPDGYLRIGAYKLERLANAEVVHSGPVSGQVAEKFSLSQRKREVATMLGGIIPLIDMPPLVTTEEAQMLEAFESEFSQ